MITIEDMEEMKEYYVEETNTYLFEDDVEFLFDVDVLSNIAAYNIYADNIDAWNINAANIEALDIKANDISYYAVCFAYKNIECNTIKGRRENSRHFVLDGELIVGGKKNDK